jgi:hypothetical protein
MTVTKPAAKSEAQRAMERQGFKRRLGYYLLGVAIGCVLAGMLISARMKMAAAGQGGQGGQAEQAGPAQSPSHSQPPQPPLPAPSETRAR